MSEAAFKQETRLSLTNRATHLWKRNGVADLLKHASPQVCHRAEFGRSATKGVRIKGREPQNWGALAV